MPESNKRYTGDLVQNASFNVTRPKPLDDRAVVRTRADLLDPETWRVTDGGNPMVYSGMLVVVTDDTTEANNGLYALNKATYYNKQRWDSTLDTYNASYGWKKVGVDADAFLSSVTIITGSDVTDYNTAHSTNYDSTKAYMKFVFTTRPDGETPVPQDILVDVSDFYDPDEVLWVTFTKAAHSNGSMTCDKTYAQITAAISDGKTVIAQYQPVTQGYPKQFFTLPTFIDSFTLLFANQTPNNANEVLFVTMTSSAVTLAIEKDYMIPDVASNSGKVLTANALNDDVEWKSFSALSDMYIITITETENSGTYTHTCDRSAEDLKENVVVGGKLPIFVLRNDTGESPMILSYAESGIEISGDPAHTWHFATTLYYDVLPSRIRYEFNSEHVIDGATDYVVITRSEIDLRPDWNQSTISSVGYIKNKPTIPTVPTVRTMNHEQLTDSTLGDINIHDGFYFPNATQDADGNWYGAVVIGDQVWMGENLRTTKLPDGTPITNGSPSANNNVKLFNVSTPYYYWFNDSEETAIENGLLYNVSALMNGESNSSSNPSGVQGISPNGWHLPSKAEFIQLTDYVSRQQRFFAHKSTFQEEVYDEIETIALNSRNLFNSTDISALTENEQEAINATGFNIKLENEFYFTTDENGHVTLISEWSTGCSADVVHVTSNQSKPTAFINPDSTISLHDYHNESTDDDANSAGTFVRCVSNLTPIQFRNWYIAQYGSLQHHLPEDNFGDNIYDGYYFPNATQDADGNWYGATVIGDQVWLGENFRCTSLPDGTPIANGSASTNNDVELFSPIIPYYYWVGDDSDNTEEYGLKYNFSAITNGESLGNNGIGVKGISPEGWHVPCVDEYDKLLSYISQKENYVELWHGYIRTPVLAKVDFLSSTYYNSLSYNLKQLVNATGFSLNVTALGTCELQAPATTNSEAIRALVWFNANNYFRLIYKNADPGSTDGSGLPLRLLSDMTPIQFRNWYVETYGSMQHHLPEEVQAQADWNQTTNTAPDYIKNKPTIPVITGKADKVTGATNGNLAGLDSNGNLTDSGKNASHFGLPLSYDNTVTVSNNAASVTFPSDSRKYFDITASANLTLNITANNSDENYILISNTGSVSIHVTLGTVSFGNTALTAANIITPINEISCPAGKSVEISAIVFSGKAIISCSGDLETKSAQS